MDCFRKYSPLNFSGKGSEALTNKEKRHNMQIVLDMAPGTTEGEDEAIQANDPPLLVSTFYERSINETASAVMMLLLSCCYDCYKLNEC